MTDQEDKLIEKMDEVMSKHSDIVEKRVAPVEELVKRNDRLLRGNNGDLGLNARVSRLEESIPEIKSLLEKLNDKILTKADMELLVEQECEANMKEFETKVDKKIEEKTKETITFKSVVVYLVQPAIIALLLYIMLEFIPNTLTHIGGG